MQTQYKYQASASWTLHRHGFVKAGDGIPFTLDFSVPPELAVRWHVDARTPALGCGRQLLRGHIPCMAEKSNLGLSDLEIAVEGIIEKKEGSLRFTKIILHLKP